MVRYLTIFRVTHKDVSKTVRLYLFEEYWLSDKTSRKSLPRWLSVLQSRTSKTVYKQSLPFLTKPNHHRKVLKRRVHLPAMTAGTQWKYSITPEPDNPLTFFSVKTQIVKYLYFRKQLVLSHRPQITIRHKTADPVVHTDYLRKRPGVFWFRNVSCFEPRWGGALPRFSGGFVKWLSFESLSSLSSCISLCLRMELNATSRWLWEKAYLIMINAAPNCLRLFDVLVLILAKCIVICNF